MKPVGNFVLVKPHKEDTIIQQDGNLDEYGEVIAAGPDVTRVKVRDIIAFSIFGMHHIEKDGAKFYFVPDNGEFIMGIVDGI
jgi:hypothetical protein